MAPNPAENAGPDNHDATDRALLWVITEKHIFTTDYVDTKASDTVAHFKEIEDGAVGKATRISDSHVGRSDYSTSKQLKSEPEMLIGCDHDLLIPTTEQINTTFLKGQNLWCTHLAGTDLLPPGSMPAVSLEPYSLMRDVPPLPQDLRNRQVIRGRALWRVPSPEVYTTHGSWNGEAVWDPEHVHGVTRNFSLSVREPTGCGISSRHHFDHFTSGEQPEHTPNGLTIFIFMWSYILSTRLLEMQKRSVQYSTSRLSPFLTFSRDNQPPPGVIVIHLRHASKPLVRWLCALLVRGPGWLVQGRVPPWMVYYTGDFRFAITTERVFKEFGNEKPPSSTAAADLLVEFCRLYPFGSQPTAAFLAALALPFHVRRNLQPQFPRPSITGHQIGDSSSRDKIREYVRDLPYYMTLSISPRFVESAAGSIFWEPGVPCNLASAWLGSIHQVIKPILEAGDMERLARVFALHRPRLAPLWLGIALCGCTVMMDMIESYLTTDTIHPLFSSWAQPDTDVAVWTGSPQSFLDEDCSGPYTGARVKVLKADVLRHRFDSRLGLGDDNYPLSYGWQPFGTFWKTEIEPELWPRLERKPQPRKYIHWVWWLTRDKSVIERGFRHDKGGPPKDKKEGENRAEKFDFISSTITIPDGFRCDVQAGPSKEATCRLLDFGSTTASGDRSIEAIAGPNARKHPWLSARDLA